MKEYIQNRTQKLNESLLENTSLSYSAIQKIIRIKDVKVNGNRVKNNVEVYKNDTIIAYYKEKEFEADIVYQDENILVVNKPPFITSDELFSNLSKDKELYYIHRLDRNTDGIMIFAKNKFTEENLLQGFKERRFSKYYRALVYGKMDKKEGVFTDYLLKNSDLSKVKIFDKEVNGSVKIKTGYKVIKENEDNTSLLEIELFTGKTHQIRAHLAYKGHQIIGDGKYGKQEINKKYNAKRQLLTSYKLKLDFPIENKLSYLNNIVFIIQIKF